MEISLQPRTLFLRELAQDIINFNSKRKDLTLAAAMKKFYGIMKKHGITQGEWDENGSGRLICNPEWTMCLTLFMNIHHATHKMETILTSPPKELLAYGTKPKAILPTKSVPKRLKAGVRHLGPK